MKLYIEMIKLLIRKVIFRRNNGTVIKEFCEKMGIVYIKFAQILATQNYGNLFTEKDRIKLSSICDNCNPISFDEIELILKKEYGENLNHIFRSIDKTPVGSASVSQVHRAILNTGEEVAIKIKRKDITDNIEKEIERLKSIVHRFGRFVKFGNYVAGDQALDLFLKWIREETDFEHEKSNIKTYQAFADSVNNKVENTKLIKIPKLYDQYCTDNIIVMEFIKHKTINQLEISKENDALMNEALNSYIKASFHAFFNNKQIVFHGDPHSGNIYIDEDGNIGFLDMGLLFVLSDEDEKLLKEFFLASYSGNYEKLYNMLIQYSTLSEDKKLKFKEDCKKYCEKLKNKEVTYYFTDMINICLNYEICPPDFLFCMSKAFVCLNGINHFSNNQMSATKLLQEQVFEYLLKRSLKDFENVAVDILTFSPRLLTNTVKFGLVKAIVKESVPEGPIRNDIVTSLKNLKETIDIIIASSYQEPEESAKQYTNKF